MLIDEVVALAQRSNALQAEDLEERMVAAFQYFYPDAVHDGYRPDVVDFFSALRTYLDIGSGLRGGFSDAPHIYRSLKSAIARMLIQRLRQATTILRSGHSYLNELVKPGNVIITSNWDLLIERYAQLQRIPMRLEGVGDDEELVLLKLHGSLDWCLGKHARRRFATSDYSSLGERLFGPRPYTLGLPARAQREQSVVRIRALENWGSAWRLVRRGASETHMVTMARGKSGDIGPLRSVWRDAYGAISRASRLEIVGYSLPPDDIEIRTLLRAGLQRGDSLDEVVVRNPSPEVHVRVRQYLDSRITSEYRSVPFL